MAFNQNIGITGLGTTTVIVPTAEALLIDGKLTLPTIPEGVAVNSAVVVTINQNGSPIYVGQAGAKGFHVETGCLAGDTFTVVLTSALAVDNAPNAVSCVLAMG